MAFPSRRSDTIFAHASTGATTLNFNYPSDSVAGDLIVIKVTYGTNTVVALDFTIDGPDWVVLADNNMGSGLRNKTLYAFRGSETSATITRVSSGATNALQVIGVAYDGSTVDSGAPVGVYTDFGSVSSGTAIAPTLNTLVADTEVAFFATFWTSGTGATVIGWSSATEILENNGMSDGNTHRVCQAVAYKQVATQGGASGAETATASGGGTVAARGNVAVAVQGSNNFPYVRDITEGFRDSNSTSNSVSAPADAQTGDLIIAVVVTDSSGTHSSSTSGWTQLINTRNTSGDRYSVWAGIKGTATEPLVVTGSTSVHGAWSSRAIARWSGNVGDISVANATGSSTTPDPPSLTTTSGDNLWFAIAVGVSGTTMPIVAPTGYMGYNGNRCNSSSTSTHVGYATAWTLDPVATENPGTFSGGSTSAWGASTLVVPPLLNANVTASDTGSGSDTATVNAKANASDTGSGADISTGTTRTASDASNPTADTAAVDADTSVSADTGSGSDTATLSAKANAADTGSGLDAASLAVTQFGTDAGQGTETQSQRLFADDTRSAAGETTAQRISGATDSGSGLDDGGLHTDVPATPDTGSGSDTSTGIRITAPDSGAVSDTAVTDVDAAATDQGSGLDNSNVKVPAVTDTGSGSDTAFSSNTEVVNDSTTAPAVEVATIRFVQTDSIAAADLATTDADIGPADLFIGAELATVLVISSPDVRPPAVDNVAALRVRPTGDTGTGVSTEVLGVTQFGIDSASGADSAGIRMSVDDSFAVITESAIKRVSGFLIAPRVYRVAAESRQVVVAREDRTRTAEPESRVWTIGKDSTWYDDGTPGDSLLGRTLKVRPESRVFAPEFAFEEV